MRRASVLLTLGGLWLLLGVSCLQQGRRPYAPARPLVGPDVRNLVQPPPSTLFPERSILETRSETAPQTLARIEEIVRQIAAIRGPEPEWQRGVVQTEIDSIRKAMDRLEIGTGTLFRQRLGRPREEERRLFKEAAALYVRWGLAQMRTGDVNQRVWGAEKLRQAIRWDPEDPMLTLLLGAYLELAGYWDEELGLFDAYTREWGQSDLIDLQLIRGRERSWKVTRFRDELEHAINLCGAMALRKGGWNEAPPWLNLERARLRYLADSTEAARRSAGLALAQAGQPPTDTLTAAQAELLFGVCEVRRLEYESARVHLERARSLAAGYPQLIELASWMSVPWDLWTKEERSQFDRSGDRREWVERFWSESDPILATPSILEGQVEYWRRVGEAWFSLMGVDPATPGPLSDPGQAILRFGWPSEWTSTGAEPRIGLERPGLSYAVNRTWRLVFRLPSAGGIRRAPILFQDSGSATRFTEVDTVARSHWPPFLFSSDFGGREYRLNSTMARFRQPDGRTRLVLSYDTYLPDYSVRYPLQGFRFEGSARIRSTLLLARDPGWKIGLQVETAMEQETTVPGDRTFRRRAAAVHLPGLLPGVIRVPSLMTLRDPEGRITGLAADNGEKESVPMFGWKDLEASDLLLLTSLGDTLPAEADHVLRPGVNAYGPDLASVPIVPRAGRLLLPNENLAFYVEVYNLDHRRGLTEAELLTSLEHLRENGTADYSVTLRGQAQTLTRAGIDQWNIIRSFSLSGLEPGSYRFRVAVSDHQASEHVQRVVTFRIVSPEELVAEYNWARIELPSPSR